MQSGAVCERFVTISFVTTEHFSNDVSGQSELMSPSPEKFSIFSLKIAIFGAFWAAIFTV